MNKRIWFLKAGFIIEKRLQILQQKLGFYLDHTSEFEAHCVPHIFFPFSKFS